LRGSGRRCAVNVLRPRSTDKSSADQSALHRQKASKRCPAGETTIPE
jgi:hypothetical protein